MGFLGLIGRYPHAKKNVCFRQMQDLQGTSSICFSVAAITEKMAVVFITALVVTLTLTSQVSSQASKSGHCPMARTVTNCINRCKSDFECSFNKKCCVNVCGSTSCAESGPFTHGSDLRDFRNDRNSVYCDNVKCQSGEKCVLDTRTKRNKCGRG